MFRALSGWSLSSFRKTKRKTQEDDEEGFVDNLFPGFKMSVEEETRAKYIFGLKPEKSVVASHETRRAETQCAYMLPTLDAIVQERKSRGLKTRVLDVGCGPGSITIDLAKRVGDAGEVVGADLSGAVLETAKVNAEQEGVGNVRFQKADVYALPFGDGEFDVVCTHQAVAHFHDHVKAIRELIRVARKGGGVVCMREGDLYTARFWPAMPELEECFETITRVHEANGGAGDAGRKLKRWTVEAGVPRENIVATHSAWSYNTEEERKEYGAHWPARCTQGAFADRAMELGVSE